MAKLLGTGITADRTAHWPDNDAYVVTAAAAVVLPSAFAVGDLLQASSATALAKLAAVATGNVLLSGGVTTASAWGKVGLTTHVSGTLPVSNGGNGLATLTIHALYVGNGTSAPTAIAVGANSTVLVGHTGADPSFDANPSVSTIGATTATITTVNAQTLSMAVGSPAATGGTIRMSKNISIVGRDAANANDVQLFNWGGYAVDQFDIGDPGQFKVIRIHPTVLAFNGNTASFPALKRSATDLQVRLGDDSGYSNIDAAIYKVSGVSGIDASITTGALVGKTITVSKGIITGFA